MQLVLNFITALAWLLTVSSLFFIGLGILGLRITEKDSEEWKTSAFCLFFLGLFPFIPSAAWLLARYVL